MNMFFCSICRKDVEGSAMENYILDTGFCLCSSCMEKEIKMSLSAH